MSLSINPYTEEEARRRDAEESKKKFLVPEGFKTILPKPDMLNVKPGSASNHSPSNLDKHGAAYRESAGSLPPVVPDRKTATRELGFKSYFKKLDGGLFSKVPLLNETENITAVEAQKKRDEAKQKEKEAFNKKLVVADPNFHVKHKLVGVKVLDKYKGFLEEEPKKPGYKMPTKYTKDKIVQRDEFLKQLPISFNLDEAKFADAGRDKLFKLDRAFNPKQSVAPTDFELIKIRSPTGFVNFPRRADVFTGG